MPPAVSTPRKYRYIEGRMLARLKSTDKLIRPLVRRLIANEHASCSDFSIYEEFALWGGTVRADFAALNGVSRGYEIKSEADSLARLAAQRRAYNQVFDQITLIAHSRHLQDLRRIPPWWGIILVESSANGLRLVRLKDAIKNPKQEPSAIASLLWRHEAIDLLTAFGLDSGARSKPMDFLVDRLSSELAIELLSDRVRQAIRARGDWKVGARRKQDGGKSPRFANSSNFRRTPYGNTSRCIHRPS
jgi:hypothetical protein